MSEEDDRHQTSFVGTDAACLSLLTPRFESATLPALEVLGETGGSGPLQSGLSSWTPNAWPTRDTRTTPAKHGVFRFLAPLGVPQRHRVDDEVHPAVDPVGEQSSPTLDHRQTHHRRITSD